MVDSIKKYIDNRIQLVKLNLIGVLANLSASLISSFFILLFLMMIMVMLSFSLAHYFGNIYDDTALGFATVGGIYLLIFFIYMIFIKKNMELKVKDAIVQAAFDAEKEITEKKDE